MITIDPRQISVVLISVSVIIFFSVIVMLTYMCGYLDGRVYVTPYDANSFDRTKVNTSETSAVVEGEMS